MELEREGFRLSSLTFGELIHWKIVNLGILVNHLSTEQKATSTAKGIQTSYLFCCRGSCLRRKRV